MNKSITRYVGLITFCFFLVVSFQVIPASIATGSEKHDLSDRVWTTGPTEMGVKDKVWTSFCKDDVRVHRHGTQRLKKDKLEEDLAKVEGATVKRIDGDVLVRFDGRVFFENNKAIITESARPVLDKVVRVMRDNPSARVDLEGHTNNLSISESQYDDNQELSEARAQAARDYLVADGVSATRTTATGYGDSRLLESDETAEARRMNRRVDFRFRLAE